MKNSTVSLVLDHVFSDDLCYYDVLETIALFADTCTQQQLTPYALASIGDDRGTARDILAGAGQFFDYVCGDSPEIHAGWAVHEAIPDHRMTFTLKSDNVFRRLMALRAES